MTTQHRTDRDTLLSLVHACMRGVLWYNALWRSRPLAPDSLRGIIERITYHNEENGYTVAQLTPDGASYTVPVIGNMLGLNVGESVLLTGAWVAHAQYGRQFKVDQVRTVLPATIAGLEKYLGSGLIKGIGPVTAKRIVRKFGLDTLRVIEEEPARLHEVLGVGRMRVELITRAWAEQQQIKEVMLFLQSHNVSTGLAVKIYKQYGDDAIEIVKTDPYRLAREIYGIGFVTADKIARELGIAADAPERVAAGVAYVLGQAADEGSVYLPATELATRSAELLGVSPTLALDGIAALRESEQVWVEDGRVPGRHDPGRRASCLSDPLLLRRGRRHQPPAPADRRAGRSAGGIPGLQLAGRLRRVGPSAGKRRRGAACRVDPAADAGGAGRAHLPRHGADRRAGHRQNDLHPQHHPPGRGRGRAGRAGLAHRSRGQAAERNDRTPGEDDPPPAGVQAGRGVRVPAQRGEPAGSRPGDRGRGVDARPAAHEPPAEGDSGRRAPPARGRCGSVAQRRRGGCAARCDRGDRG